MKRFSRKPIVTVLIFFFVLASIFCCCFGKASYAEASNIKVNQSDNNCHSQESGNANNSKTKECECHYSSVISANLNFDFLKPDVFRAKDFQKTLTLYASIDSIQNISPLHSKHSLPRLLWRSVPLYLENSILRI